MKVTINSLERLDEFAQEFAKKIRAGDCICLKGNLGAGKTTFTRLVLSHLGVKENVSSPTFAILKTYQGKFVFHHFDTYRIDADEAIEAGFDEVLAEKDSVKFIEWSENISSLLPSRCINVNIKIIDENTREFEILCAD